MTPGFTLLEALVAVVILGFLLAGLTGGARFGADAALRQGHLSDRTGELDAADRTLRELIATADPAAAFVGTAGSLAFTASVPGERGAKSVGLGLRNGQLVVRITTRPPGRPIAPLPVQEAVLAAGVRAVSFSFFGPGEGVPSWFPQWSRPGLPALLRLHLDFADASAPRWPDMVLAPQRSR